METTITVSGEAGASVRDKPPRENLVRAVMPGVEFRDAGTPDDGIGLMTGEFARFNEWTEINSAWEGHFLERVAPSAFDKTFAENGKNIRVLYDHGHDPSVGNKPLGPIRELRSTDSGAYYEVPLFDTSYNRDLLPALKAGQLGASFRFKVVREEFNKSPERAGHNPQGLPERTIVEAKVLEFGPVTFPAYPGATAGVRSMTDDWIRAELFGDEERMREFVARFVADYKIPEVSVSSALDPKAIADAVLDELRQRASTSEQETGRMIAPSEPTPPVVAPRQQERREHIHRKFNTREDWLEWISRT